MLCLINQVFVALLSFSKSSTTKCVSLNNEPCMIRPTLFCLNLLELNYCPLMISLDECNESCNTVDDLFKKICVPSETKDVTVEVFNMITKTEQSSQPANIGPQDVPRTSPTNVRRTSPKDPI